jgi:hypothetical protein
MCVHPVVRAADAPPDDALRGSLEDLERCCGSVAERDGDLATDAVLAADRMAGPPQLDPFSGGDEFLHMRRRGVDRQAVTMLDIVAPFLGS